MSSVCGRAVAFEVKRGWLRSKRWYWVSRGQGRGFRGRQGRDGCVGHIFLGRAGELMREYAWVVS